MKKNSLALLFNIVIICVAIIGCSPDIEDTKGNIRGKIVDSMTDEPLQGVTVTISPKGESTVTGNDGTFEFVDLTPSQYSIQAQKDGYKTNYKQISIFAGETGIGDMSLTPILTTNAIQIRPECLDFEKTETEMTFEILNQGNIGNVKWNISGVESSWIKVSPLSGEVGQGLSASIKVSVDRNLLMNEVNTTFIHVNFPGGSKSVKIIASK